MLISIFPLNPTLTPAERFHCKKWSKLRRKTASDLRNCAPASPERQRPSFPLANSAASRVIRQSPKSRASVASRLAKFHKYFYSTEPDPPDLWPRTYDRTDLQQLPPCARYILEHPNDLLLMPSGMRRIVAVLLSLGWHTRHVAGLSRGGFNIIEVCSFPAHLNYHDGDMVARAAIGRRLALSRPPTACAPDLRTGN